MTEDETLFNKHLTDLTVSDGFKLAVICGASMFALRVAAGVIHPHLQRWNESLDKKNEAKLNAQTRV